MAEAKRLLATTRLLTLTGSGGAGKTRLALHVAGQLLLDSSVGAKPVFPDSVWLVELAPLTDPAHVPQTTASVFDVRVIEQLRLIEVLTNHLRSKNLLLLLDNCEHLIEACAQLADMLLHACPDVRILAITPSQAGIWTFAPQIDFHTANGRDIYKRIPIKAANAADSLTFDVEKGTPKIQWNSPADIVYGTVLDAIQLNATASVSGTFAYTPSAGTLLNPGIHTLDMVFTPDDTTNYVPVSASVQLNVLKATPMIVWANPQDIDHGTALDAVQLNAAATWVVNGSSVKVPGVFVYTPAAGAVLDVGIHQPLTVQFTPADGSSYLPATSTVYLNVKGPNLGTQISFMDGRDARTGSRAGWYVVTEVDTKRVLGKWYALSGSTDSGPFTTLPLSFVSVHVTVIFYPDGGGAPITMKVLNPAPGTEYGWATKGECAAIEVEYP